MKVKKVGLMRWHFPDSFSGLDSLLLITHYDFSRFDLGLQDIVKTFQTS